MREPPFTVWYSSTMRNANRKKPRDPQISTSMLLFRETLRFAHWTARILRQFVRVRPGSTLLVILSTAIARITRILAFFLPLKVILLAGSSGVPRYLPFVQPDGKTEWIIGLTIGAFAAYGLTLLLQSATERWSLNAGREILRGANQISLHGRQEEEARSAFSRFSGVVAGGLFIALSALLLSWINPALLGFISVSVALVYLFTAWSLRGECVPPPRMKARIQNSPNAYLGLFSTLIFFGAFLVILAPFLLDRGGNILIALLSVLLTQQILGNLSTIAKTATALLASRPRIDPLIFPDVQLKPRGPKRAAATLQVVFAKERRQRQSVAALAQVKSINGHVAVCWEDSTFRSAKTLHLIQHDSAGQPIRHYQQQIFAPSQFDQLENETVLFHHVPRERLKAPRRYTTFEDAGFRCQICDYGDAIRVSNEEFLAVRDQLLRHILSYRPGKTLIRSYRGSRVMLHQRLTTELCSRLNIGIDTAEEAEILERWMEDLPETRRIIQKQPLVLYNPDLNRNTVTRNGEDYLIMAWGRWMLEPLGVAMFLMGLYSKGHEFLETLRPLRTDFRKCTWDGDLRIAGLCGQLEQQILREQYKAALRTMKAIMTHHQPTVEGASPKRAAC